MSGAQLRDYRCGRKHRYPSRRIAIRYARRTDEHLNTTDVYPCPEGCGGWHIGHRNTPDRRGRNGT